MEKSIQAITNIPEQISKDYKSFTEACRGSPSTPSNAPPNFRSILKETINETKKEEKELEDRKRNIIIFNADEPICNTADDRKTEDIAFFKQVFKSACGHDCEEEITQARRLGKNPENNTARPLLISVKTEKTKRQLLSKLYKLRENEQYKAISINHDMTRKERKRTRALVEEAKKKTADLLTNTELSEEAKNWVFRMRGPPWEQKMVKANKQKQENYNKEAKLKKHDTDSQIRYSNANLSNNENKQLKTTGRHHQDGLKCLYTNADSLLNKREELSVYINLHNPDIIGISEAFPKNTSSSIEFAEYKMDSYDLICNLDKGKRGVCLYTKSHLKAVPVDITGVEEPEAVWCEVKLEGKNRLLVGCIYRSPNSNILGNSNTLDLIKKASTMKNSHLLIMGDFNHPEINWSPIQMPSDPEHAATKFVECLRDCFLHQHIEHPTHY
eukprot:gene19527-21456_t